MTEQVNTGPTRSEHGFCPLLSGRIVPTPGATIAQPNMVAMSPIILDCPGKPCQWWSIADGCCCVRSLSYLEQIDSLSEVIRMIAQTMNPPKGGSPIMRTANALEKIVKMIEQKQTPF